MVLKSNDCYQKNADKRLVWRQNRHQTAFYRGALHLCSELDILKFEQTSLFYSASYFNLEVEGLELCFGGAKPTMASTWRLDCVAKLQLGF